MPFLPSCQSRPLHQATECPFVKAAQRLSYWHLSEWGGREHTESWREEGLNRVGTHTEKSYGENCWLKQELLTILVCLCLPDHWLMKRSIEVFASAEMDLGCV